MSTHLVNGEFQSDKYPTTPRGKVPLSVKDKSAQDLLWQYAQRRRAVDAEFADDLEVALREAGLCSESPRGPRCRAGEKREAGTMRKLRWRFDSTVQQRQMYQCRDKSSGKRP